MKLLRTQEIESDDIKIGDQIKVPIANKKHIATCYNTDRECAYFIFNDILFCMEMYDEIPYEGVTYENSKIRQYLKDIVRMIPGDFTNIFMPNEDGDHLWLANLQNVIGVNTDWSNIGTQLVWFKKRANRLADLDVSWWLRDAVTPTSFAHIHNDGLVNFNHATNAFGVRPCFKIKRRC